MFEETEGLPDCPELAQRYRTKHVPPKRVETLPMLTHTSQFDTYLLRFWHGLRFGRTLAASDLYARALDLRFRWRKLASLLLVLKSSRLVSAIAKRLICRVPTAAESDCLPDAQQSLSAAVGTLQISLFAMALTRRLDFRTSSRLASFLHRNLRSKALAYRSDAASVRPKRNPCQ